MEEKKKAELGNSLLAILGGAAAGFLAGLILYPVEQLIADEVFEMSFSSQEKGITINDIIFYGSVMLWLFVAAWAGGIVCSLICKAYEYIHAFILTGILLVLMVYMNLEEPVEASALGIQFLLLAFSCAGFLSGAKTGIRIKKRKEKNVLHLGE